MKIETMLLLAGAAALYWSTTMESGASASDGSQDIWYWTNTISGEVLYQPGLVAPGPEWRPASVNEIAAVQAPY